MESRGGEAGWRSIFTPLQLKAAALLLFNARPSYSGADLFGRRFQMAAVKIRRCSFERLLSSYPFPLPGFPAASADPLDPTRCSISENKAWSQTERLAAPQRLEQGRGGAPPVPRGLISHPDIMIFFFPGKQMDFLLPEKRFKLPAETTECHRRLLSGHL